jgi:hypothetical protein
VQKPPKHHQDKPEAGTPSSDGSEASPAKAKESTTVGSK